MGERESQRWILPAIRPQTVVLCSQQAIRMYTNHRIDQDSHQQQFGTKPILISAPQWPHKPCNAPTRFYRVVKKPFVKANLVIYSHIVDASGQCTSISLILSFNLDFSSFDNLVSFVNSVTYYACINHAAIVPYTTLLSLSTIVGINLKNNGINDLRTSKSHIRIQITQKIKMYWYHYNDTVPF